MDTDAPDLTNILLNSAGNLYWKDLEGRYLGCNKNLLDILHTTSDQIIGKTDRELFSKILPPEKIALLEQADQLVLQTGQEEILEEEGIDREGNPAFYLTKKQPLYNQENTIIGLISISLDITQKKRAEYHDYIISQVPCNLYWKDINGNYLGCNEEFAKVLHLQSPKEIVGKNDNDFFLEPEYVKYIKTIDQQVVTANKTIIVEELGTGLDKSHAIYMTKKSPLLNKQGVTVGIIGASVDITKEKQAEIAKREFVSSMSHDIRTPFSGLYSMTEFLYGKEEDAYKKKMLGYILESADTLLEFLNKILELTHLSNFSFYESTFNISELINNITKLMSPSLVMKSLQLVTDCPQVMIKTDRMRLECMLINLIGNAIKFTHKGNITVRVKVTSHLICEVEDTGIGIPPEKWETIFDKFYRIVPTYEEPKFSGVGIGLYISRLLARELGGDITVNSEIGKGSCFTLFIPHTSTTTEVN